jgi:phosphoglycerol transferase MdoB-like AlkP superfamily enzyme
MKMYGNQNALLPFDSLAKSLVFTNLYAGNRTVRGLKRNLMPPTAGESVVKREDNKNKFSTGSIFKQKGYAVKFMYGDAFFDNMEDFSQAMAMILLIKKHLNLKKLLLPIFGVFVTKICITRLLK